MMQGEPVWRRYAEFVNGGVERQVTHVLGMLSRAQQLFGAGQPPADPPVFAAASDLEDDLGRGHF